jgi:hypothetical protein
MRALAPFVCLSQISDPSLQKTALNTSTGQIQLHYVIRNMSSCDQPLPAGAQFWICSSTGFVTLTDNGRISVAGSPAPTVDPSGPAITGLSSLMSSGQ